MVSRQLSSKALDVLSRDDSSESSVSSVSSQSSSSNNEDKSNAPENLVRRENKGIAVLRLSVISIAVGAAALAAWFLYTIAADAEEEAYLADFTTSAETLVEKFISEISTRFFMAGTLSSAVTAILESSSNMDRINLTFPGDRWSVLTQEMRFRGFASMVSYAPLVTDNDSRKRVEEHVSSLAPKVVPPCFTCDSLDQYPLYPDTIMDIPGVASFPCYDVWSAGLTGVIPEDSCGFVVLLYKDTCGCTDAPEIERQRARAWVEREGGTELPNVLFTVEMNSTSNEAQPVPLPYENDRESYHLPIAAGSVHNGDDVPLLYDQATYNQHKAAFESLTESQLNVMSPLHTRDNPFNVYFDPVQDLGALGYFILSPVFSAVDENEIVGVVSSDYSFHAFFRDEVPYTTTLLLVQLENTCGEKRYTTPFNLRYGYYGLEATDELPELVENAEELAIFSTYEAFDEVVNIASIKPSVNSSSDNYCRYRIKILPTKALRDEFITNRPYHYAIASVVIFVFSAFLFFLYDVLVKRRQTIIVDAANKTNDIVVSLFPSNVRDRLLGGADNGNGPNGKQSFQESLNRFLATGDASKFVTSGAIADLFPHVVRILATNVESTC